MGLDHQTNGGTHVPNTADGGTFAITKTDTCGNGNKRARIQVSD